MTPWYRRRTPTLVRVAFGCVVANGVLSLFGESLAVVAAQIVLWVIAVGLLLTWFRHR